MSEKLFKTLSDFLPTIPGWCPPEKAEALAAIVLTLRPTLVVEIGVFAGRSLQAFGLAMLHVGHGRIIGIDPWSPVASLEGMENEKNREWWGSLNHEQIYETCLSKLRISGVDSIAEIWRKKSDDCEMPDGVDVIHLDGSHEETAYRDTVRFAPKLRIGGLFVADDLDWSSGATRRGADWLLANGFIQLYPLGTGAVFQRIK